MVSENVGVYGINQGDLALNSGNYDLSYRENVGVYGINQGDLALNSGNYDLSYRENVGVYGINQGDLALNSGNYDLSYRVRPGRLSGNSKREKTKGPFQFGMAPSAITFSSALVMVRLLPW